MIHLVIMWIHLTAAIAFIGGTIFYFVAYRPASLVMGRLPDSAAFTALVERRFRTIRWLSVIALLITGFFNLLYEGGSPRLESAYGGVLMIKLLLVLILVALTAIHDFVVGPQGRNRTQPAVRGTLASSAKPPSPWLGLSILLLSLAIIFISVKLASM